MIPADDRAPVSEWEPTTLDDIYALLTNLRPEWHQYAACRGTAAEHSEDGNIFFPERGGNDRPGRIARRVCATCQVRAECLEFGLTQKDGIWGGTDDRQRRPIRAQRNAHLATSLERCGTEAGYQRHLRHGAKPCAACRSAHNARVKEWRARTA